MTEHYKQLPENYDDTIYEGFEHYDDSGWSEKKWNVKTENGISYIETDAVENWGATEVRPAPRRQKRKPSVPNRFFGWLWRNLPDVLVFIVFLTVLAGFVLSYTRSSLVDMLWYGVLTLLFAAGYSRRK